MGEPQDLTHLYYYSFWSRFQVMEGKEQIILFYFEGGSGSGNFSALHIYKYKIGPVIGLILLSSSWRFSIDPNVVVESSERGMFICICCSYREGSSLSYSHTESWNEFKIRTYPHRHPQHLCFDCKLAFVFDLALSPCGYREKRSGR